jgi:HD domain
MAALRERTCASLEGPIRRPESWLVWLRAVFAGQPSRFEHVHTVWVRACELRLLGLDWYDDARAERLELAALLHDVGRALDPDDTEPHGFVGARFLDGLGLHDVAPLVAHHSAARFEAELRGMTHLDDWRVAEPGLLHLLTLLDRTTDGRGRRVGLLERRADIERRHGRHSRQARNFDASLPAVDAALTLLGDRAPSFVTDRRVSAQPTSAPS